MSARVSTDARCLRFARRGGYLRPTEKAVGEGLYAFVCLFGEDRGKEDGDEISKSTIACGRGSVI